MATKPENVSVVKPALIKGVASQMPVSSIKRIPQLYRHRGDSEFTTEKLDGLYKSIVKEGMHDALLVYRNEHGEPVLLSGHRRLAVIEMAIKQGVAGFTPDMIVDVIEYTNLTEEDRIVLSILHNEQRQKLAPKDRLAAAAQLYKLGTGDERAASALNVGVQTYKRDIKIAKYPRLMQHVVNDNLGHTQAAALIEVAETENRVEPFLADFDDIVALKRQEIRELEAREAVQNRALKPHQRLVRSHIRQNQVETWIKLIHEHKRLFETTTRGHRVIVQPDRIDIVVRANPKELTPVELALLYAQLRSVEKPLEGCIADARERPTQVAGAADLSGIDLSTLDAIGCGDLADQLATTARTGGIEAAAVALEDEALDQDDEEAEEEAVETQPAAPAETPLKPASPAQAQPKPPAQRPKAR